MIHFLYLIFTGRKNFIYVSFSSALGSTEISFRVGSLTVFCHIIVFRMKNDRIILCFCKIKNRFKNLISHLYQLHCSVYASLIFSCNDCNRISHISKMPIQNQTVIRAWFRKGLARLGISLRRHIFISKNSLNPRNFFCIIRLNLCNYSMCMGTSKKSDDKAVRRSNIIRINRTAGKESPGILFYDSFIHKFCFFKHILTLLSDSKIFEKCPILSLVSGTPTEISGQIFFNLLPTWMRNLPL